MLHQSGGSGRWCFVDKAGLGLSSACPHWRHSASSPPAGTLRNLRRHDDQLGQSPTYLKANPTICLRRRRRQAPPSNCRASSSNRAEVREIHAAKEVSALIRRTPTTDMKAPPLQRWWERTTTQHGGGQESTLPGRRRNPPHP